MRMRCHLFSSLFPYTTLFRSDFIGASYWEKNLASIKVDGRWVLIGVLGGSIIDSVNLRDLMMKRIQLTRSEEHTSELQTRGHLVCRLLLEKKKQYNQVP